MVNIRLSRPEEAEAQKKLWQMAFGDDPRYIDWFYACCWKPENMLLLLEDNKLASMLALLPHALVLPNGETASAYYVYALATDPAVRSKGYGRQLLHYVDFHLAARGADCVTVVPAEPSLFKFFATAGFTTGFYTRKAELLREETGRPQPEDRVEPVSPQAYNAIRDRLHRADRLSGGYEQAVRRRTVPGGGRGSGRLCGGGVCGGGQRAFQGTAPSRAPDSASAGGLFPPAAGTALPCAYPGLLGRLARQLYSALWNGQMVSSG